MAYHCRPKHHEDATKKPYPTQNCAIGEVFEMLLHVSVCKLEKLNGTNQSFCSCSTFKYICHISNINIEIYPDCRSLPRWTNASKFVNDYFLCKIISLIIPLTSPSTSLFFPKNFTNSILGLIRYLQDTKSECKSQNITNNQYSFKLWHVINE